MNKIGVLDELASLMDDYTKKYFIQLGEWLIVNDHVDERLRKKLLGLNFQGGGSPTMALFAADATQRPHRKVVELLQFGRDCSRQDVSDIVKNLDPNITEVHKLDFVIKQKIAYCLDVPTRGATGWEHLAERFGYNDQERQNLKQSYVVPGDFSPTKQLFRFLKQENESLSVKLIIDWSITVPYDEITQLLCKFFHQQIQP